MDQRGELVRREREPREQPNEIRLAQWLATPPLRVGRRCDEQEEDYGRAHPDCSNFRSTESTRAYSA